MQDLARQQQQPLLDTLRDLVSIESGSKDLEGLDKIAHLIADRLKKLGGQVEIVPPADVFRMDDTPAKTGAMVRAVWKGTGTKNILLIAHMDTVYLRGMLKDQPFRIEGEKAYGLGIADDKQGVALIVHTVAMLQKLGFRDFGTLTVLINGDEEISSPDRAARSRRSPRRRMRCSRSKAAAATGACAWRPAASARRTSAWRAGRRTRARGQRAGSTRSTSSRTRSCSCATCRRTSRA